MNTEKKPISAVVITYNVAATIGACLEALLKVCDEVLVLDSFSNDATVEIAKQLGARVLPQEWLGYAQTKNAGNDLAKNDWILSIDSDEVLSDELINSLKKLQPQNGCVYALDRLTNYCGKWIYHSGWYPEWKIRLFDKKAVKWQGRYVHESLLVPEAFRVEKLKGKLYHYSYLNKKDHLLRIKKYARLAAQERFEEGIKPSLPKMWFSAVARFFKSYILKKGFLDGREGWLISWRSAYMIRLRHYFLKQLWDKP